MYQTQTKRRTQTPYNADAETHHLRVLTFFPFFPSIMPSNFLLSASLNFLCPAHSLLIRFMRQLAITMKPTARNDRLFCSVLPIFPRRLSPRRRRGDEGPGVMPISERRLRSTWLLCNVLAWCCKVKEGRRPAYQASNISICISKNFFSYTKPLLKPSSLAHFARSHCICLAKPFNSPACFFRIDSRF